MRRSRIVAPALAVALAVALAATAAAAGEGIPEHPRGLAYPELRFEPPKPEDHRVVLPNGLRCTLVPDRAVPAIHVEALIDATELDLAKEKRGLGKLAVGGMLAGSLLSSVLVAIFMANAGGAWDNAKKYIEGGQHGGKGSPAHKAAVVGDTVGEPFKDTAGPSLNILIKLMSIVSLIFAPLFL